MEKTVMGDVRGVKEKVASTPFRLLWNRDISITYIN